MPAQVEFHTGVADPVGFACRLLRKAWQQRARVLVTAPPETLVSLDQALWAFEAQGFLPHVRLPVSDPSLAGRTPIWLAEAAPAGTCPPVLVNLGGPAPAGADDFVRVIEIVAADDDARRAARARWRLYEGWGAAPVHHGGEAG